MNSTVLWCLCFWIVLTVSCWKEMDAVAGLLGIISWWLIPDTATSHSYKTCLTHEHIFRMCSDFLLFMLIWCACVWLQLIDTFSSEISELKQEMVQPARDPETEILQGWVHHSLLSSSSLALMGVLGYIICCFQCICAQLYSGIQRSETTLKNLKFKTVENKQF